MLRFGLFEADLESGELRKQGLKIKLQDQPFQILTALLAQAGQVVTREELREQIWGSDTFVDFDRGLNKAINKLREALDDSADNPRFIETVPKRGYRFIAPVESNGSIIESSRVEDLPNLPAPQVHLRHRLFWALALFCLGAVIAVPWFWIRAQTEPVTKLRSSLNPPPNTSFLPNSFALSSDGTRLAFVALDREGKSALWIRSLLSNGAQRFEGTDGATFPFWSPDHGQIGFFAERKLKTLDVAAGSIRILCDASSGHAGSWNQEGIIIFSPSVSGPLYRIDAGGGTATPITTSRTRGQSHSLPSFLPDGRNYLFYVSRSSEADQMDNGIYIGSLASRSPKLLSTELSGNVIHSSGHLLYVHDRSLFAQPFDPLRLQFKGEALPIAEQELDPERTFAVSGFTVSKNGVLVFQSTNDSPAHLLWYDPTGNEQGSLSDGTFRDPSISPDGHYLAVSSDDAQNGKYSIRVFDLARNVSLRLTEPGNISRPTWSNDGKEITYGSTQGKISFLYSVRADGSSPPRLLKKGGVMSPNGWSSDGHLVFQNTDNGLPFLNLYSAADQTVKPFVSGAEGQFSPDGKWISYIGRGGVAGGGGIVVQPYPGPGPVIPISGVGGAQPRWGRDGRGIFYMAPDRKLMSATFDPASGKAGQPHVVFQTRIIAPNLATFQYDVAPDGRFIINSFPSSHSAPLTMITGWQSAKRP